MARRLFLIPLLALGFFPVLALAQTSRPTFENPQFESWHKYGIGSTSRLSGTLMSNGMKMAEMTIVYTLLEKTDDHVTIEVVPSMTLMGQSKQSQKKKETINARTEVLDMKKVGSEKVSAMSRLFDCTVWEHVSPTTSGDKATPASGKVFLCNDVPGGVVKMDVKSTQGDIVLLLQGFEIK